MKPSKPKRTFHVVIDAPAREAEACAIYGETFFAARAKVALADDVEPGDVHLDPPRRHS